MTKKPKMESMFFQLVLDVLYGLFLLSKFIYLAIKKIGPIQINFFAKITHRSSHFETMNP